MASSKFVFLFLAMFVAVQFVAASPRDRRDTPVPDEKPADTLANIQNFLKENLQFDKIVDNLKEFGTKVQTGTQEFAETVQNKANELFKPAETKA